MSTMLPWNKMNDYILSCGEIHNYRKYCEQVLNKIDTLVPFDQGRLYFLNDNGKIYDEYLVNVDKQVTDEYHDYYSKVDNGCYDIGRRIREFSKKTRRLGDCVYDWNKCDKHQKFFKEYIIPNNLRQSFGLGLRDDYLTLKSVFILDRNSVVEYTQNEIEIMNCVSKHLDNLHQNLFVKGIDGNEMSQLSFENIPLTSRELEIAELLKMGVTPQNISDKLCISKTTVKKHISNMHIKLNVSTRQELIVKLLNK